MTRMRKMHEIYKALHPDVLERCVDREWSRWLWSEEGISWTDWLRRAGIDRAEQDGRAVFSWSMPDHTC